MKLCPECRREYFDDSLIYCLEDGSRLTKAPVSNEAQTLALPGATDTNSIAVLPFVNISADPENEYFCDGLAEELLNALSHIKGLKVAARTSAFSFKDTNTNISEIGRNLGVKNVLEGSVRKSGERVRISVQLINASDGFQLWSERFDRELKDIFDIQDQITLAVVESLKLRLLGGGREQLLKRYTDNPEAYALYLQGRFFWNKRTTESTQKAISFYEKAIALDSKYALAYSGIADCYNTSGFAYDLGSMPFSEVISKAKSAAEKALEIDGSLAEAHTSLAYAKHLFDWDWEGAEKGFRHALKLNPNYANARHWYAHLLTALGRPDDALVESEKALDLDPVSAVMNNHLGWHHMYARNYDAAVEQLNHTLLLDPGFVLTYWYLGITYCLQGRYEDAETAYKNATRAENEDLVIRADAAHFYAVSGQTEKARAELSDLESLSRKQFVSSFSLAMICVGLDRDDEAFHYFEKAFLEHSDMLVYINVDPRLDRIRGDGRFKKLVQKVGLPEQNI